MKLNFAGVICAKELLNVSKNQTCFQNICFDHTMVKSFQLPLARPAFLESQLQKQLQNIYFVSSIAICNALNSILFVIIYSVIIFP